MTIRYDGNAARWMDRHARAGHITSNGQHGTLEALAVRACPSCGAPAVYAPPLDRYLHADGTDSRDCWRAALRGDTAHRTGPSGFQHDRQDTP